MIDKEKKYAISDVSQITGYDKHVLRYYESDFNLKIPRTSTNRRYYTYKEIGVFIRIKKLQEKGLTNKQIKRILHSSESLNLEINELSMIHDHHADDEIRVKDNNYHDIIKNVCKNIDLTINSHINNKLEKTKNEIIHYFDNTLKDQEANQAISQNDEINQQEKDILLCENAKLKMKLKEKSYELAELKEKLNRINYKNTPFWKKIFS